MNPIPYGRQDISTDDIEAVVEVLKHDFLTQGPKIKEFEEKFANYIGCNYAVAVANGTAALHLCAIVLGVNENSKVITTPITFAASANCVRYNNGEVVFSDIDLNTGLIDLNGVKRLLESAAEGTYQGIIPVDFAGMPVDFEKVRELADKHGLWIIEDACHAPGGSFIDSKGINQRCGNGSYADLAIFSFHPVKHIACGEGGMITTNDKSLYERLLILRSHGITKSPEHLSNNHGGWYYEMIALGYNYRLTDIQAALGISQLNKAEKGIERRRQIANQYDKAFQDIENITILNKSEKKVNSEGFHHAYHLYVILVKDRKGLYDDLRSHNIYAQIHYIPVHTLPYYQSLGYTKEDYPEANKYYEECLSLPMYPTLTNEEQSFVINKVLAFLVK